MTLPQHPRRTRGTRLAGLTAAGAALALVLGACSSGADAEGGGDEDGAADLGDITVQLSWIKNAEFAGEFFADSKGYFADAGFSSVTLNAGPGATESIVLSGGADFGLSNAVSVGQVVAEEDAPLKIVGTTFQKNPFTILSLKDGGDIATPEDLKGKRIGVQAGPNEALFDALLAINEIDPAEVTKVPVEYDPSPLVNGEVDGFLAYVTNESITVESEGNPVTNLLFADNGLPFVAESVVTTDEMIANEPEKVKAFLEAEIRGWKDAVADPEEGARLAVEEYGKDLELDLTKEIAQATIQAETLIVTDETKKNGLFTISDALIEQNLKTLAAAGIELEAEDLFDLSLLTELLEEQPELAK
ncbi:ABC transporter substrate-binding protein [Cellulomonas wangsupingiae]|uniref:Thiamine pyrimidine synthase n=1 Tax=Cellulomonas wangsupingiae TaxID=2968085 RepID=A0ABY5K5X6_9CELL|nr:ABC transporter substrate-binding protein [Cellulomonas wangsupingiae]MCC2335503.1 ABC transporter substrate-binding protein [Cellulomonas wangsupingiae]MCM0639967.1 ABC transporter substrate-binding protein [Cellulomonas wangsupingiae]UUI64326.1 ABC transporter substrate-binding protein [Cellulomonas wangsupingiae]